MKKLYYNDGIETNAIYFDYSEDFPELGSNWIMQTAGDPITDCDDLASDYIEGVERMISELEDFDGMRICSSIEEAEEEDFECVRGLVENWGL